MKKWWVAVGVGVCLAASAAALRLRHTPYVIQPEDSVLRLYDDNVDGKDTVYALSYIREEKSPFVVVCPGGAYSYTSMLTEGTEVAEKLNELGYSAFVLNYRVKENAAIGKPQEDLAALVRYLFGHAEEMNLDTSRYGVCGFSAGGHLAASFGTKNLGYEKYDLPRPDFLILGYPVITMQDDTHKESRTNLLGKNPSQNLKDAYSIERNVDKDYPKTYIWKRKKDFVVKPGGALRFVDVLRENGVDYVFREYDGYMHGEGLGLGKDIEGWFEKAAEFVAD